MSDDTWLQRLDELSAAHGPSGDEREIDAVVRRMFEATGADVTSDLATNLYAHLPGDGPSVLIMAHKDEIGLVVTNVREDGRLEVSNCGGSVPWKYGEGPVDILSDDGGIVRGVLSVGSIHTRQGPLHELKSDRALTWDLVTLFTGLDPNELADRGVHVGSRAVVARERKRVERLGEDYIAAFALDDRIGLAALWATLDELIHRSTARLDLHFVATHGEEIGMIGALHAARRIQPDVAIALDTSPVTGEMPVNLDERPAIWYREATFNDKAECDRLLHLAEALGVGAQPVAYTSAASDAGRVRQHGWAARTLCLGIPRDNSHGFEIAHRQAVPNLVQLLLAYLDQLD